MTKAQTTKKHLQIMHKHIKAMHTELGKLWNIPSCCIKQFVKDVLAKKLSATDRANSFGFTLENSPFPKDYVPCDKCFKKFLKENNLWKK